jgi:hypothetical protein
LLNGGWLVEKSKRPDLLQGYKGHIFQSCPLIRKKYAYLLPSPSDPIIAVAISHLLNKLRLAVQTEPMLQPIYQHDIVHPSFVLGKKIRHPNPWISKTLQL